MMLIGLLVVAALGGLVFKMGQGVEIMAVDPAIEF
jgi:hypothetical protein